MRAVALYGGSFDPVHQGHLAVARDAVEHLHCDEIVFVPAARNPLRGTPGANGEQRLSMLRLAIAGESRFSIDEQELTRGPPSYSYDSIARWRLRVGASVALIWIVGRDAFAELDRWHRWQELTALCHFLVVDRPGTSTLAEWSAAVQAMVAGARCTDLTALRAHAAGHVYFHNGPHVDASSSRVRMLCQSTVLATSSEVRAAAAAELLSLLGQEVCSYIRHHRLYGWTAA